MDRVITIALKNGVASKRKRYPRFFEGSRLSGAGDPQRLFLEFCRSILAPYLSRKSGPKGEASGNPVSIPGLPLYRILTTGGQGLGPGLSVCICRNGQCVSGRLKPPPWTFFRVKRGIQRSAMPVERVVDRQSDART